MISLKAYRITLTCLLVGVTLQVVKSFPVNLTESSHQSQLRVLPSQVFNNISSSEEVPHMRLVRSADSLDAQTQNGAGIGERKIVPGPQQRHTEANVFDKYLLRRNDNATSSFNTPHPRSKRTIMFLIFKHAVKKFFKFFLLG